MVPLGSPAPDFALPDTHGKTVSRADFAGKPLLVMFICNHCPYVKHIAPALAARTRRWMKDHVAVVGISSNDVVNYPEDSPAAMVQEVADRGYKFPYLFDDTQEVARAYDAQCTPDFFLYDAEHKLVYRGQFDGTRPGQGDATGDDLDAAVRALLQGDTISEQKPSIGCNIKWKG